MKTEAVKEPEITQKVEQKKQEKTEAKTSTEAFGSTEQQTSVADVTDEVSRTVASFDGLNRVLFLLVLFHEARQAQVQCTRTICSIFQNIKSVPLWYAWRLAYRWHRFRGCETKDGPARRERLSERQVWHR